MTLNAAPAGDRWVRASTGSVLLGAMALLVGCGGGESPSADSSGQELAGNMRAMAVASTGSTYYVDASGGKDSNSGSSAAPWKTLARVAKQSLSAGDMVLLRCGGLWRESWVMSAANMSDGVTFGNYGTECGSGRPRVLGSDDFTGGWTKSGNVWSRKVPAGTPKIARLFIGGVAQRVAQWPNHSASAGFASVDSTTGSSTTQFKLKATDIAALSGKDLVGATAHVRPVAWSIQSRLVSGYSSGLVTLASASAYAVSSTTEYVLTDKSWMVDAAGEFFHDDVNNVLYAFPSSTAAQSNLNAFGVEGAVRDYAAMFSGRSGLAISGVSFEMSRMDGIAFREAPKSSLSSVVVAGNGRHGISVVLAASLSGNDRGITIDSSIVRNNAEAGVMAQNASRVDVLNSQIFQTGTEQIAGNSLASVFVGPGSRVEGNVVAGSALIGIRYSNLGGSIVRNNVVSGYCGRLSDCAGIYTWNGPKSGPGAVGESVFVTGNTVFDNSSRRSTAISGGGIIAGIYLDDFSRMNVVSGNSVVGGPYGIYIHNGSDHTVQENLVVGTGSAAVWMLMDQTDADYMSGNLIQNNTILRSASVTGTYPSVPTPSAGNVVLFQHATKGSASISSGSNKFSGNLVQLLNTGTAGYARVGTASSVAALDAGGWRALAGSAEPAPSAQQFLTYKPTLGAELMTNGGFTNGLNGWSSWFAPPGTGGVFGLLNSQAGCVGGCVQFNNTQMADYLMSSPFLLTGGNLYEVRARAVTRSKASLLPPFVGRSTVPYTSFAAMPGVVTLSGMSGIAGDVVEYRGMFRASTTASGVTMWRITPAKSSIALDEVSLRQVTGYSVPPQSDLWRTVVAEGSPVTVTCSTLGWPAGCAATDFGGAAVSLPVTVPARSARVFLRGNSAWAYQ